MKTKRTKITVGINKPSDMSVSILLDNLNVKKLHELARQHGSPIKKYKYDTVNALARAINAPGRGLTATVTIEFLK